MGKALTDFGLQTANNAAGGIMGMVMGGINDRRQIDQQKKLQDMQMKGQKEMTEYQRQKQLQMWKDTNYSAQMGELKKAGLNPGLIYGMSGGGGATTGAGTAAGPSSGNAPQGGGEMQAMIGMGIQSALLEAQRKNIEANTEKTKAETANVPLTGEQTKASTGLTNIQTELAKIEQQIKGSTTEAAIRTIDAAAEKMMNEAELGRYGITVKDKTWETEVDQIKANLVQTLLKNEQTKAQTASEKQALTNAIQQLELMRDELNKTNPEKRKMISTQMQAIWRTIEQHKDSNDNGEGVIQAILKLIPIK